MKIEKEIFQTFFEKLEGDDAVPKSFIQGFKDLLEKEKVNSKNLSNLIDEVCFNDT